MAYDTIKSQVDSERTTPLPYYYYYLHQLRHQHRRHHRRRTSPLGRRAVVVPSVEFFKWS